MAEWQNTFDPVSKADWLRQIESDLAPRTISSVQSEWWPGEVIHPFLTAEDLENAIHLPDNLFSQPPQIMEWIDTSVSNPALINNRILEALQYGAQSIVLHSDLFQKTEVNSWLDKVF